MSVLRGWVRGGDLSDARAKVALADLAEFPWTLWDERPLLPLIWRLRHNVTAYDAAYAALALSLGCPLLTGDAKLAQQLHREGGVEVVLV